jgi:hypothetical protein
MILTTLRGWTGGVAVVAAVALQGACLGATEDLSAVTWEGSLQPAPGAAMLITGDVYMVANPYHSEAAMVLHASVESDISWIVRSGSCDGTGSPIAAPEAFEPFEDTAEGPTAIIVLNRRINVRSSYAAELRSGSGGSGGSGTVLSCADMIRTN